MFVQAFNQAYDAWKRRNGPGTRETHRKIKFLNTKWRDNLLDNLRLYNWDPSNSVRSRLHPAPKRQTKYTIEKQRIRDVVAHEQQSRKLKTHWYNDFPQQHSTTEKKSFNEFLSTQLDRENDLLNHSKNTKTSYEKVLSGYREGDYGASRSELKTLIRQFEKICFADKEKCVELIAQLLDLADHFKDARSVQEAQQALQTEKISLIRDLDDFIKFVEENQENWFRHNSVRPSNPTVFQHRGSFHYSPNLSLWCTPSAPVYSFRWDREEQTLLKLANSSEQITSKELSFLARLFDIYKKHWKGSPLIEKFMSSQITQKHLKEAQSGDKLREADSKYLIEELKNIFSNKLLHPEPVLLSECEGPLELYDKYRYKPALYTNPFKHLDDIIVTEALETCSIDDQEWEGYDTSFNEESKSESQFMTQPNALKHMEQLSQNFLEKQSNESPSEKQISLNPAGTSILTQPVPQLPSNLDKALQFQKLVMDFALDKDEFPSATDKEELIKYFEDILSNLPYNIIMEWKQFACNESNKGETLTMYAHETILLTLTSTLHQNTIFTNQSVENPYETNLQLDRVRVNPLDKSLGEPLASPMLNQVNNTPSNDSAVTLISPLTDVGKPSPFSLESQEDLNRLLNSLSKPQKGHTPLRESFLDMCYGENVTPELQAKYMAIDTQRSNSKLSSLLDSAKFVQKSGGRASTNTQSTIPIFSETPSKSNLLNNSATKHELTETDKAALMGTLNETLLIEQNLSGLDLQNSILDLSKTESLPEDCLITDNYRQANPNVSFQPETVEPATFSQNLNIAPEEIAPSITVKNQDTLSTIGEESSQPSNASETLTRLSQPIEEQKTFSLSHEENPRPSNTSGTSTQRNPYDKTT